MEENKNYIETGKMLSGEDKSTSDSPEFREMAEIWNAAGNYVYAEEDSNDAAWNALKGRIEAQPAPMRVSWVRRNRIAVAAAVALLAVAGVGIWMYGNLQKPTESLARTEKTGNREIKTVQLEDGTVVVMNSNSSIMVAAGFNTSNRRITLVGEAQFEVARNEKVPFIVSAGGAETKVLGTGFDICAYPGEKVQILVSHGKVQFGTSQKQLMLLKGEAASFTAANAEVAKIQANTSAFSWQNGTWVFKSTRLDDIALQLKHRFGKTIRFDAKYSDKLFTGRFDAGTNVAEIAKTLSAALDIPVTEE